MTIRENTFHTSDSDGNENLVSYQQFFNDCWEFDDENQGDVTDIRSIPANLLVDATSDTVTVIVGGVAYTPMDPPTFKPHWPAHDTVEYGNVVETAISLIASAGHGYGQPDEAGNPVDEDLQTALMDAMFRSPGLKQILDHTAMIAETAIVRHNSQANSES